MQPMSAITADLSDAYCATCRNRHKKEHRGLTVSINMVPVFFTAAGKQKAMPASLAIAAVTTLGYAWILVGPAVIGFVAQHFNLSKGLIVIALGLIFAAASGPFLDGKESLK